MLTEILFGPAVNKELEPGECELLISLRFDEPETRADFADRQEQIAGMFLDLEDDMEIEEMEKYSRARLMWQSPERM